MELQHIRNYQNDDAGMVKVLENKDVLLGSIRDLLDAESAKAEIKKKTSVLIKIYILLGKINCNLKS